MNLEEVRQLSVVPLTSQDLCVTITSWSSDPW
jgi:hypothetical protein